jgi:hypothetical protein
MELVAGPLVHKLIVGSDPDIVVCSRYEVQVSRKSSKILKIIIHIVAIGRSAGHPGKNEEPNGSGAADFIGHRAHVGTHTCDPSGIGKLSTNELYIIAVQYRTVVRDDYLC